MKTIERYLSNIKLHKRVMSDRLPGSGADLSRFSCIASA
eukprot:UN03723